MLLLLKYDDLDGFRRLVAFVVDSEPKIAALTEARWMFAMFLYHILFEAVPCSSRCAASEAGDRSPEALHPSLESTSQKLGLGVTPATPLADSEYIFGPIDGGDYPQIHWQQLDKPRLDQPKRP